MNSRGMGTVSRILLVLAIWVGSGFEIVQAAPNGENAWVELEVRGWSPTLKGSVQSTGSGLLGTNLNFDSTLGVNTQQSFLWPKATLHVADRHRLSVSGLQMQYGGDKTIAQNINFGGSTFAVNTSVHSELDFKEIVFGYQYDFLKFSRLAANFNFQVHYLDIDVELRSTGVGTAKEDFQVPIPTIGGGIQAWPFDWLKMSADFNIFKLGVSGFKGELIDSQAALTISPWEWLGLSVGYRYYRIIARDTASSDRADWLQKGPYAGIMVRF
ncbi:MAG: hypothetical protein AABZ22_06380 [Nitrospirota bacterium]